MTRIDETRLPGIGIRHDFVTAAGTKIGVITYRDGRREIVVFDERDPDECRVSVHLDEEDARTLADLLGVRRSSSTWNMSESNPRSSRGDSRSDDRSSRAIPRRGRHSRRRARGCGSAGERAGNTAVPLYLLVGVAAGSGGSLPLGFSAEFIAAGAQIGVLLLLFMLGLEFSGDDLAASLRSGRAASALDTLRRSTAAN